MIKKILFLSVLFISFAGVAQDLRDNFYVKLMSAELNRNIQKLKLPELEKPFFISYRLRNQSAFNIRAERGDIVSNLREPVENRTGFVKVRVGDYHRNFDYLLFDNSFINLPDEKDADEYKRLFWMETDRAYKNVSQQYSSNMAALKRVNVDAKELALDDMGKITPLVKDFGELKPIKADFKKWDVVLKQLSLMFMDFPDITNSYCQLNFNNYEDYLVTSEGTIVRKPVELVSFSAYASIADEDGSSISQSYSTHATDVSGLPDVEFLRSKISDMIAKILQANKASKFEDSYLGPVLFVNDAAGSVMQNIFGNGFVTRRKQISGYDFGSTDLEDKLGQKMVSSDLTVTALPGLKSFNGKQTTGSFEIDDEGIIPPDSLVLIKNGLLKSLLSGRTPTQKFPAPQGFTRSFGGRGLSPGVLRISSSNTIPADSMKSRLIRLAKEEGLKQAYIVKDDNYTNSGLYKVNLITGEETRISGGRISNFNVRSLRRFVTASNKMSLRNSSSTSIIAPESFIVNEVEIEKVNITAKPKPIIVTNPLLDKKNAGTKTKAKKR